MKAGTLEIELLANIARLQKDMDEAKRVVGGAMASIEKTVGAAKQAIGLLGGVLSVGMFAGWVKSAIDAADKLDDMAEKTGIAAKQLSALKYAGEVTGTPLDSLSKGILKLSQNMASAASGSKAQADAFRVLGISVKNADGSLRDSDRVLGEVADKFVSFRNGPAKAALAIELFGKAGAEMIPLLNQGAEGISELKDEAEAFGLVIGNDVAKAAADFNDNLTRMQLASEGFATSVAAQVLPTLNQFAAYVLEGSKGAATFGSMIGTAFDTVAQTVAVLGANIMFVLKSIGRELAAWAAQVMAALRGDFAGFTAISDAVKEDGERARKELDAFEQRVLGTQRILDKIQSDPRELARRGRGTQSDAPVVPGGGASTKAQISEYEKLAQKLRSDVARAISEVEAAQLGLNKAQTEYLALTKSPEWAKFSKIEKERVKSLYDQLSAIEETKNAERDAIKVAQDRATARAAEDKAIQDYLAAQSQAWSEEAKAAEDAADAAEQEMQQFGMLRSEIAELTLARLLDKRTAYEAGSEAALAVERQIAAQRRLIEAIRGTERKEAEKKATEQAQEEWQRTADQIGQSLSDALMEGGRSFGEYLKGLLRTEVGLWIKNQIVALMNSIGGKGGTTTGSTSSGGMVGGIGSVITKIGENVGSSFLTTVGKWLPGIGAVVGVLSSLFGNKNKWTKGFGEAGVTGGLAMSGQTGAFDSLVVPGQRSTFSNANYSEAIASGTETLAQGIADMMRSFGGSGAFSIAQAASTASKKDQAETNTAVMINGQLFETGSQKSKKEDQAQVIADQALRATVKILQETVTGRFGEYFDSVDALKADIPDLQALLETATAVQQLGKQLQWLGGPFDDLTGLSVQATSELAKAAGGYDQLLSSASAAYNILFSEQERAAELNRDVAQAFADLNVAVPDSRQSFIDLLESIDESTESGAELEAQLLALVPAWDQVKNAATPGATASRGGTPGGFAGSADDVAMAYGRTQMQQTKALVEAAGGEFYSAGWDRRMANYNAPASVRFQRAQLDSYARQFAASKGINPDGSLTQLTAQLEGMFGMKGGYDPFGTNALKQAEYAEQADRRTRAGMGGASLVQSWQEAMNRQFDLLQQQSDEIMASIEAYRSLNESLRDFKQSLQLGSMSTLTPQQQYELARAEFERVSGMAAAGDTTAQGMLQGVISTFLEESRTYFGANDAYVADMDRSVGIIDQVVAQRETLEEKSVKLLESVDKKLADLIEVSKRNGLVQESGFVESVKATRDAVEKQLQASKSERAANA